MISVRRFWQKVTASKTETWRESMISHIAVLVKNMANFDDDFKETLERVLTDEGLEYVYECLSDINEQMSNDYDFPDSSIPGQTVLD